MASIAPSPRFRAFSAGSATSSPVPLVGGKLWSYEAGTLTLKPTYIDEDGITENPNPVILNSRGEAEVWLGAGSYKLLLTDANDVQQGGPVDNVSGIQAAIDASQITFNGLLGNTTDAAQGDALIGVKSTLAGSAARTQHAKNADLVSLRDFGAVCDGVTNDTAAVQAAFSSGVSVFFPGNCAVTTVNASAVTQTIDFNGYALVGMPGAARSAVLEITGRELNLYGVKVNVNFNLNYTQAIRWHSASVGTPAQFNKVYGMHIMYSIVGLTFGAPIGSASVDAPQGENVIHDLTFRGVQTCFVGNQANGFITLVSPVIDCNPYEWTTLHPGIFSDTLARCINNPVAATLVLGGEILKTYTQLGYALEGGGLTTIGTAYEVACSWGLIDGQVTIRDADRDGYMAGDSIPAFVIAAAGAGKSLLLDNVVCLRGAGVAAYSGTPFIDASACPTYTVTANNCRFDEWRWTADGPLILGCPSILRNVAIGFLGKRVSTGNPGILRSVSPYGADVPADGALCASWLAVNFFGGGSFFAKRVVDAAFVGCPTALEFTGSAGSTVFYGKFVRATSGNILVTMLSKFMSGTGVHNVLVTFFGIDRVELGANVVAALTSTTSGTRFDQLLAVAPTGTVWMRLAFQMEGSSIQRVSNLTAVHLDQQILHEESVYVTAAPAAGTWALGERVYVLSPVAGGYTGYLCTAGGTPGTWKGFGLIQA